MGSISKIRPEITKLMRYCVAAFFCDEVFQLEKGPVYVQSRSPRDVVPIAAIGKFMTTRLGKIACTSILN